MKKIVTLALAALMMLSAFVACSDGSSNGSSGDTIKIGGIGPLSGEAETYGKSVKNGAELAVKEINEAGGVNGVKLELMFQDDEADGAKAKSAYEKLMDDGMQILMGAVTSGASVALNDLVKQDGILQVSPSGSQKEVASENDNAFRICFTDPLQGTKMADYVKTELKYTKAAIIYNQDDSYSTGIYEAFKAEWEKNGGTVSADTSFSKDAKDFSAQMTKIKSSDAEFLFMPIYAEKAAQIALAADEKGVDIPMVGCDGLDGILSYLKGDQAKYVEGLIYLTPFVASDKNEHIQKFVAAYNKDYGTDPDQFAADAYDAVYVIKEALTKADVKSAKDLDNAALVKAMTEIEVDGLTGNMTFDKNGDPNKDAKVAKIVDGQYVAQ